MKRSAGRAAGILAIVAAVGVAPSAFCGKAPKPAAPVTSITLRAYHRVFPDFREDNKVAMNEDFTIGDTDYSATVFEYIPDFAVVMDSTGMVSKGVISRTNEPNNPAFHIVVRQKGVPQDTTWAFLNIAPHFTRKSMLAFQIRRIEFKGHSAIVNADNPPAMPKSARPAPGTTGRKASSFPNGHPSPAPGPTSRPGGGR